MNNKRYISETLKKKIVILQQFKCNNSPNKNLRFIGNYECPLYKNSDGMFDNAGWEIDHIVEISKNGTNDITNLQALCPSCHSVKTKNFNISEFEKKQTINNILNNTNDTDNIDDIDDTDDIDN